MSVLYCVTVLQTIQKKKDILQLYPNNSKWCNLEHREECEWMRAPLPGSNYHDSDIQVFVLKHNNLSMCKCTSVRMYSAYSDSVTYVHVTLKRG